jgi:uroporphyrinogen decarboxylase
MGKAMGESTQNSLLHRALRGERTERPPVWLMRQAGRTDPEYLKLRDEVGLPLEALFRHPELAARISLLPRRLGIDAIIFYQDILTPLSPMGAHFVFAPGPVLETPLEAIGGVEALHEFDIAQELGFVGETLTRIQTECNGALPVLGFAGAPLTLAVFLLEGKSFGSTADRAFDFMAHQPEALHRLLRKLTDMTIGYLKYQARHGVAAVQLFESAAFLLSPSQYREFALPYQQEVFKALKGTVPTINFAREWPDAAILHAAGADVLSLPSEISITEARAQLGDDLVVQGNVDNRLLVDGDRDRIAEAVRACVAAGECRGHIFNLSHGLLRETPFENIQFLVAQVCEAAADLQETGR